MPSGNLGRTASLSSSTDSISATSALAYPSVSQQHNTQPNVLYRGNSSRVALSAPASTTTSRPTSSRDSSQLTHASILGHGLPLNSSPSPLKESAYLGGEGNNRIHESRQIQGGGEGTWHSSLLRSADSYIGAATLSTDKSSGHGSMETDQDWRAVFRSAFSPPPHIPPASSESHSVPGEARHSADIALPIDQSFESAADPVCHGMEALQPHQDSRRVEEHAGSILAGKVPKPEAVTVAPDILP